MPNFLVALSAKKCYLLSIRGGMSQGVKLDESTKQRLQSLAAQRDRSPHWLMKTAILDYLDREESYEREKREDMERWERFQLTGQAVNHSAVSDWLDHLASGNDAPCPR